MGTFCCRDKTKLFNSGKSNGYIWITTIQTFVFQNKPCDLCSSFLDHFHLALVNLNAPEETIKQPQKYPPSQPEHKGDTLDINNVWLRKDCVISHFWMCVIT